MDRTQRAVDADRSDVDRDGSDVDRDGSDVGHDVRAPGRDGSVVDRIASVGRLVRSGFPPGGDRDVAIVGAVVLLHLLVGGAHGLAHAGVPVELATWQDAFVWIVATLAPVVAVGLCWRGRRRSGAGLLTVSLAAALGFGVVFHYLLANPDHVGAVGSGPWASPFRATAALVSLTDALGVIAGAWLWRRAGSRRQ